MNKKIFDIYELKGGNINKAINNMIKQLLDDNNEITDKNDITLDRIIAEIDSLAIKFDCKGNIII